MTGEDQVKDVKMLRLFFVMAGAAGIIVSIFMAAPLWGGQPGTWTPTGNLNQARAGHTATLLPNGTVLIVGGNDASGRAMATAELFAPATGLYAQVPAALPVPVSGHTATLLKNGTVLIAGGVAESGTPIGYAQVFDPATGRFSGPTNMASPRSEHTATLLKDGRVLLAGGTADGATPLADVEVYDPTADSFSGAPHNLQTARRSHTVTVLEDGRVLVVGGSGLTDAVTAAELYNPADGTVVPAGSLSTARTHASAALLTDGTVFVAGGQDVQGQDLNTAEIYDPKTNAFTSLAALMSTPRSGHSGVTLQDNGKVLLAGGTNAGQLVPTAELYDPVTGAFRPVNGPTTGRTKFSTNFFAPPYTGGMLAPGGLVAGHMPVASSELFFYPTLRTDKQDYPPGYVVKMMGEGWQPHETISILIHESGNNPDYTMEVSADASGAFAFEAFQTESKDIGMSFLATASGPQTNWTAQAKFTDAPLPNSVQLTQWGTVPSGDWQTGNLGTSNSDYKEGEAIPFRLDVGGVAAGTYTFSVCRDFSNGTKRGYLFLAPFNTSRAATPGGTITSTNGPFSGVNVTINSFTEAGGQGICNTGQRETQATITSTGAATAFVLWGGHLASPIDIFESQQVGAGNGAASFPGGSLHMGLNAPNRDRSINPGAIIQLATIAVMKVVDSGSATPDQWRFFIDPNPNMEPLPKFPATGQDTVQFLSLPSGSYTITETTSLTGFAFASGTGTNCTFSGSTATATVTAGRPATNASCTFHNVGLPDLTIVKSGNGPITAGDTASYSLTVGNIGAGAAS
ncbi:MAG: hypothetical protein E6K68_06295 [Nitrospirae bacterium]|nr:MAG: hypothetical protein E6K68_06295 [Nitrospirota bacterium]